MADNKFILMCADKEIAELNDTGWKIFNDVLMPRGLDTRNQKSSVFPNAVASPLLGWLTWLARRVVAIDRAYIKKVLNELKLTQAQDVESKAKIAIAFRAVSLLDSYWLKYNEVDKVIWKDINLRQNSLSKSIALIALTGTSMTLQVKALERTAELSTLGSYAKGWFRDDSGQLWLYKAKGPENDEVEREISASTVIDCFNIYGNLKYEPAKMMGVNSSRCKLLSNENRFLVHAADMQIWCMCHDTDVMAYAKRYFMHQYAQMIVIDYLIANSDRHMWNWGFFQDAKTGEITGLHDLYDHNNAFDIDYLKDEKRDSIVESGYTMKEAALHFVNRSELQLIKKPTRKIFPSQQAYDVFVERCKQLGLWDKTEKLTLF